MATQFELQAIITALDKASRVFGKIGSSAKKSGGTIKSAFGGAGTVFGKVSSGVKRVDGSLEQIGKQIPAVQAAFGGLKEAIDLGREGAAFERVQDRFEKFADTAGGAEVIFDAFQKGVGGAASKMDTMAISSGLLQAGLVGNAAEMEKTVEIASRLGNQTIDVSSRIGEFSQLLKNQSVQLLDNFGISSGKVRARIKELQDQTKGLSREQAFLTATFEEADKALAILGPRTADSLTEFEKMDAQMADLRVEIGRKLAPAVAELMGVFSSGLSIVSSLIDVFVGLGEKVVDLVTNVPVLGAAFDKAFEALDVEAAVKTAEQLATLSDSAKVSEGTISEWGAQADEMMATGATLGDVMSDLAGRTTDVSKAFDEGGIIADVFVDQTGILSDAASEAADVALKTADNYGDYTDAIDKYNSIVPDATAKTEALTEAQFNMAKITQEGASEMSLQADEIMKLRLEQQAYVSDTTTAVQAMQMTQTELATVTESTAVYDEKLLNLHATQQAGLLVTDEEEAARKNLTHAIQQSGVEAAAAADRQRAAAERQKEAAAAAAEAMQMQAAAAADAAREQGTLMLSMVDATDEMVKQKVFAAIDPAEIGVDAYASLGQELGVLDEKAANLAVGVPALAQAYSEGLIPTENMAAATTELFESADKADFSTGALIDKYKEVPEAVDPALESLDKVTIGIEEMGDGASTATDSVAGFGDSATDVSADVGDLMNDIEGLTDSLTTITATEWTVDVKVNVPDGAEMPAFQTGGVVPFTGPAFLHAGEIILPPGQGTVTKNFNLTVNTAAPLEPILMDFATLEAMG